MQPTFFSSTMADLPCRRAPQYILKQIVEAPSIVNAFAAEKPFSLAGTGKWRHPCGDSLDEKRG